MTGVSLHSCSELKLRFPTRDYFTRLTLAVP